MNLAGATIQDSSSSADAQSSVFGDLGNVTVDGDAPDVTAFLTTATAGTYIDGDTISIQVEYDEAVTVDTTSGTPYLVLSNGGQASYAAGSGLNLLTFNYTVSGGDSYYTSTLSVSSLNLSGGTITDAAGGSVSTSETSIAFSGVVVDATLVMPTTGLMTWVSAKDVDGNGVADSTVNGTIISSLVDKSGNSNDFSVISSYSAPTFYSSTSMLMFNDNNVIMGSSGRVTTAMESTFNWTATAADAAEIFLVGYMPSYQDEALIWHVKISGASTTVWRSDDGLVARTTSDVIGDAVNTGVTLVIDGIYRDFNGAKVFVGELLIYDQELSSADRISVKQYLADEWSITAVDPILIDLDSDGIEMVQSTVFNQFAMTPDGTATPTNWLSSDDGLLALDINGNGKIDNITELFSEYFAEGINTGLGALSTLDENSDGIIDQNDSQFSNLQVWQDLNQDGISTADELKSLAEHGIESFDLNVTKTNESLLESTLLSNGSVGMSDGTTKSFSEVAFAVENKVVDSILVAESIDLSAIVAAGANNIEQINMQGSGSDTLSINIQDVLDITDSNNILFIDGDTGDQVIIENGWQRQVSNSESVSGYQQFSMEGVEATLYIDEDVSKLVMNS
jgi:hypothetical protein